ncbi:MAG TPA: DUF2730 family protein [Devosia sp.]|jgi:hypothetical protein|nr:DUF2730 family protein [Devosia sp.]
MDVVVVKDLVIGAAAIIAAGLTIWNFFQSPSKKNEGEIRSLRDENESKARSLREEIAALRKESAAELKSVDDKVDAIGGRLGTLEVMVRHMPDKDSQHRLEVSLTELKGQMGNLVERLAPIDNLSRRLQEVLLEKAS